MNTNLLYCIDTFIYVAISIALSWVASQTFKTVLKVAITKNKNGFPKKIVVYDPDFPKVKMAAHFYKNGLLKKDNRGKEWCKTKYHYKKGLVTKVTRKTNVVGNYIYKIKYAKPKINKKRYAFMINWMFTTNNMNICWDPITQINPLDFSWF